MVPYIDVPNLVYINSVVKKDTHKVMLGKKFKYQDLVLNQFTN